MKKNPRVDICLSSNRRYIFFLRVGHYRKGNIEFFGEFRIRFGRCPHPHQDNLHTGFGETVSFTAQLRHLLAAKRSAEVAQENQHKRPLSPELAEAFRRIVRQGHRQIGRFLVILFHLISS